MRIVNTEQSAVHLPKYYELRRAPAKKALPVPGIEEPLCFDPRSMQVIELDAGETAPPMAEYEPCIEPRELKPPIILNLQVSNRNSIGECTGAPPMALDVAQRAFDLCANPFTLSFHMTTYGFGQAPLFCGDPFHELARIAEISAAAHAHWGFPPRRYPGMDKLRILFETEGTRLDAPGVDAWVDMYCAGGSIELVGGPGDHDIERTLRGGGDSYAAVLRGLQALAPWPRWCRVRSTGRLDIARGGLRRRLEHLNGLADDGLIPHGVGLGFKGPEGLVTAGNRATVWAEVADAAAWAEGRAFEGKPARWRMLNIMVCRLMHRMPELRSYAGGKTVIWVACNGDIYPHSKSDDIIGNVQEGFNLGREKYQDNRLARYATCADCWATPLCGCAWAPHMLDQHSCVERQAIAAHAMRLMSRLPPDRWNWVAGSMATADPWQLYTTGLPLDVWDCGLTPAHKAIMDGSIEALEAALNHGADVNARTGGGKRTLLHLAAEAERDDMVALLLERGADPLAEDVRCWVPWHVTMLHKNRAHALLLRNAMEQRGVDMRDFGSADNAV